MNGDGEEARWRKQGEEVGTSQYAVVTEQPSDMGSKHHAACDVLVQGYVKAQLGHVEVSLCDLVGGAGGLSKCRVLREGGV